MMGIWTEKVPGWIKREIRVGIGIISRGSSWFTLLILANPKVDPNQTQIQPQTRAKLSFSHPNPKPIQNPHLLPAKRRILPLSSIGTIQIVIATVKLKPKASNPNRRFQPRAGPGTKEVLTDVTILPDLVYLPGQGGAIEDGMEVHYTELDKGGEKTPVEQRIPSDALVRVLLVQFVFSMPEGW
jgi:hypothetical protein